MCSFSIELFPFHQQSNKILLCSSSFYLFEITFSVFLSNFLYFCYFSPAVAYLSFPLLSTFFLTISFSFFTFDLFVFYVLPMLSFFRSFGSFFQFSTMLSAVFFTSVFATFVSLFVIRILYELFMIDFSSKQPL